MAETRSQSTSGWRKLANPADGGCCKFVPMPEWRAGGPDIDPTRTCGRDAMFVSPSGYFFCGSCAPSKAYAR
jgi:hypothetical protein